MSRIASTFSRLHAQNERAFIPFVTCGDPDLEITKALALAYIEAGADILEIGIPFTDPLADGPTIQRASERALSGGVNIDDAFTLLERIRRESDVPLVPMTYINPVWQIGYDEFAKRCAEIGVDGVIISDLPPEEGEDWAKAGKKHGVDTIFLTAPTSDEARLQRVNSVASGFIYAVARLGVTGARDDVPPEIGDLVSRMKEISSTPVCAGFGFSKPEQIQRTVQTTKVDGIVVASALIDVFENAAGTPLERVKTAANFAKTLKAATIL
jgi:tryptophan synthase alpha chain